MARAFAAFAAACVLLAVGAVRPAGADTAPANTAPPTVEGTAQVAQTLHASPGTWSGTAPSFAYQWQNCTGGLGYRAAVLADAPAGYWRLGELGPATTAIDASGNGLDGTYHGTPGLGTPSLLTAPGESDTAAAFSGDDWVGTSLANSVNDQLAFSIEAWIKRNGTSTALQWIVGNYHGPFLQIAANATTASFGFWNGSANETVSTTASVTDNATHHLVGTWDGTSLRIYRDGALSGTATPTGRPAAATGGLALGANPSNGSQTLTGTLDEAAFYRSALTAARVQAHHDEGTTDTAVCTNIASATSPDYLVQGSDRGKSLRVVVTATNLAGSATATSARTDPVPLGAPANDDPPTIDGSFQQGQTLTGQIGSWSGALPITYSYSWSRCGYYHKAIGLAPISYWRLDDLAGTSAADLSGHGNTGTYVNYPTLGIEGALNGDPDSAVGFVGTASTSMHAGGSYPTGTAAATISFWFESDTMPSSTAAARGLAGYPGFIVRLGPGGVLQLQSGTSTYTSPTVLTSKAWYHVVAVDPGGSGLVRLYLNGQLDPLTGTAKSKTGGQFTLAGDTLGVALTGAMDDVAVYNTALSAAQVQDLYAAGISESVANGCSTIGGATSSSYAVQAADERSKLAFTVTAQNSEGTTAASSQEQIVRSPAPTNSDLPQLSGVPAPGSTLSATPGGWDGTPPISYQYQWERCGYRDLVLGDHPAAYWRLGDLDQQLVGDATGNGYVGRYGSGASSVTGALRGDGDPAISGSSAVSISVVGPLQPSGAFSVEEWFKPGRGLLGSRTLLGQDRNWRLSINDGYLGAPPDGTPSFIVPAASGISSARGDVTLTNSTHWYHLVGVFTGTQALLYIDGQLHGSGNSVSGRPTASGAPINLDASYKSAIDEAAFYPTALSAAQVAAHANAAPCTDITGATTQQYTIAPADAGQRISVIVTATNGQGSASASSRTTLVGGSGAPINTALPSISQGKSTVGDVLSENDGSWVPTSGLTFTRQWERCSYAAAVLGDHPAAYWPLNEPGGPAATDASGNNNDGTYTGTPLFGVPGALADSANSAVRFDSSDYVDVPTSASLAFSQTFSLEAWARLPSGAGAIVFDAGIDMYKLQLAGGINLFKPTADLTNPMIVHSDTSVPQDGQWHHVVAIKQGTTGRIYLDGINVSTYSQDVNIGTPSRDLHIGANGADIDEPAVYPTALTAAQVQAHYDAGRVPCTPISGATGSSYTLAAADAGSSVRIKITATGSGGTTTAASLGTDPVLQQGGLALDSPDDGATARTTTPTLAMLPVTGTDPTDYQFQLSNDPLMKTGLHNSGWLPSTYTYTVPASWALKDAGLYYWRARIRASNGTVSPWIGPRSLHIRVNVLGVSDDWSMTSFGGVSVNRLNGNLLLDTPGPLYPAASSSLSASITYNSLDISTRTALGKGWTFAAGPQASEAPSLQDLSVGSSPENAAQVVWRDGRISVYGAIAGTGSYRSPPGDASQLSKNPDGSWTLTDPGIGSYLYGTEDGNGFASLTGFTPDAAASGQAKLTYSYSGSKLTKVADASGRALTFTWNSVDPTGCPAAILCISGPDGVAWKYIGNAQNGTGGGLGRINDGVRDVLAITYDASARITKLQNANDLNPAAASPGYDATHSTQIGYDGNGRVASISNGPNTGQIPSTSTWTFSYSFANVQTDPTQAAHSGLAAGTRRTAISSTTVVGPNQQGAASPAGATTYYDEFNNPIEFKDPLGHVTLRGYSLKDQLLWTEDAAGIATDNTYDSATNELVALAGPDPRGTGTATERYRYDETVIGSSSSAGTPLTGLAGSYYANPNLAGNPAGHRTDATVDYSWGAGGPSPLAGQNDNFSVRWTGYLNVTQTGNYEFSTVADGGTRLVIDQYSVIDDWTSAATHTRRSQFLSLSAGLHSVELDYFDTTGTAQVHLRWHCPACPALITDQPIPAAALRPGWANRTSTISPSGVVSFTHFAEPWRGLADYTLRQLGGTDVVTSYRHDVYGRTTEKVMPKGNVGRAINTDGDLTGAADKRFATEYDYYGDTESAAAPASCGGGSAPSQSGQLQSKTPYGIHPTTLVYDIAGRLVASTDGAGTTCSAYDNEGHLTQQIAPGESQPTIYTYDPNGAVRTAANAAGTNTLTYDEAGRVALSTDSYGAQASLAYDPDGNVVLRRVAAGSLSTGPVYSTSYGYDAADRRTTLTDPAGRIFTFTYTSTDQPKAAQYSNGTFSWNDYAPNGELKAVYNRHGTLPAPLPATAPSDSIGSPIADYAYTLDIDGRKTQEVRSGGGLATETTGYSYDALGRLAIVSLPNGTQRSYSYDPDSNRTAIVENGQTVATYSYDPATTPGVDELTSATQSGQSTSYRYGSTGDTTTRGSDSLTWDGRGRLAGGTFSGTSVSYSFDAVGFRRARTAGSQTTHYLLGGLFETTSTGTVTSSATDGPDGDLVQYAGPPATGTPATFLYYNGHGDLAAEATSSGSRTAAYTYDPFGAPNQSAPPNSTAERWAARWNKKLDTASGLIEMGARTYEPLLGRFLSPDPVETGSQSGYAYSACDPVNGYDLTGLIAHCEGRHHDEFDDVFTIEVDFNGRNANVKWGFTLSELMIGILGQTLSYFPSVLVNGRFPTEPAQSPKIGVPSWQTRHGHAYRYFDWFENRNKRLRRGDVLDFTFEFVGISGWTATSHLQCEI